MLLRYYVQVFTNVETYTTENTDCINYKDETPYLYVEIKCQLDATEVFIADLIGILFSHINGNVRSKSHQKQYL